MLILRPICDRGCNSPCDSDVGDSRALNISKQNDISDGHLPARPVYLARPLTKRTAIQNKNPGDVHKPSSSSLAIDLLNSVYYVWMQISFLKNSVVWCFDIKSVLETWQQTWTFLKSDFKFKFNSYVLKKTSVCGHLTLALAGQWS